jgi:hypothetical protein
MALLWFGWDLPTNRGGLGGVGVCVVTLWTQSSMALDLLWTSIDEAATNITNSLPCTALHTKNASLHAYDQIPSRTGNSACSNFDFVRRADAQHALSDLL